MISMLKYRRAMEQISVTPELERRILRELEAPRRRVPRRALCTAAAACLALLLCCTALLPRLLQREKPPVQITSQMQAFATVEELADSLTFPLSAPSSLPAGYAYVGAVNQFGMAQLVYEAAGGRLRFYMAPAGTAADTAVGSVRKTTDGVTLSGGPEGWLRADWSDGGYDYSLVSDTPLAEADLLSTAASVEPLEQ